MIGKVVICTTVVVAELLFKILFQKRSWNFVRATTSSLNKRHNSNHKRLMHIIDIHLYDKDHSIKR